MKNYKNFLSKLPKKTSLLWTGTALAIMVATFAAGVYVARYKIFPYAIARDLGRDLKKVASVFFSTDSPPPSFTILTHLYALEAEVIPLELFEGQIGHSGQGGGMENMDNGDLLIATPHGRLARITPNGEVSYFHERIPMNKSGMEAYVRSHPESLSELKRIRVGGILLKEHSPKRWDLFATHHYFDGKVLQFRLSSTTLLQEEKRFTILPQWKTLFEAQPLSPNLQRGGKMLMDGNEHLLILLGSYGKDVWNKMPNLLDNPDYYPGGLIRVEISTGKVETLTSGHRSPLGLTRDKNGRLWSTENGPQGGDELNLLEPGLHYGWPHVSYGIRYESRIRSPIPLPSQKNIPGRHDGFQKPVFAWVPSIAPSGIVVNEARWFPLWKDDFLIATLRGKSIYRVRLYNNQVQYVERIEIGERLRDIKLMSDGRIALLGDQSKVLFLSRSTKYCTDEYRKMRSVYAVDCDSYEE